MRVLSFYKKKRDKSLFFSPHFCEELVEFLLALEGPHLELAGHADRVTDRVEQRPVSIQRQRQLLVKHNLQTVDRYHVVFVVASILQEIKDKNADQCRYSDLPSILRLVRNDKQTFVVREFEP